MFWGAGLGPLIIPSFWLDSRDAVSLTPSALLAPQLNELVADSSLPTLGEWVGSGGSDRLHLAPAVAMMQHLMSVPLRGDEGHGSLFLAHSMYCCMMDCISSAFKDAMGWGTVPENPVVSGTNPPLGQGGPIFLG